MQTATFTFVQTDRGGESIVRHWNAEFDICPGQQGRSLAKYAVISRPSPLFVQDKMTSLSWCDERRGRRTPPQIEVFDAVATGTSGAESGLNNCAEAAAPSHHRAKRGVPAGLLAAQLRRSSVETSRALLLLPPSLVRSGALRSDIYPPAPAKGRRARGRRVAPKGASTEGRRPEVAK